MNYTNGDIVVFTLRLKTVDKFRKVRFKVIEKTGLVIKCLDTSCILLCKDESKVKDMSKTYRIDHRFIKEKVFDVHEMLIKE